MKQIWIDTETGGLKPEINPIVQLSGKIVDGEKFEEFNFFMNSGGKPMDQASLDINGYTTEQIAEWEDPKVVFPKFRSLLDKFINRFDREDKLVWYGYNAMFDVQFVRQFFLDNGDGYFGSYFFTPPVDVWMLACMAMEGSRADVPNTKLISIAKWYGVDVDKYKAHDSLEDIRMTEELYKRVMGIL